ncbi:hypothetical protein [uncultured Shimia sp.]|uniref:hypothetical protein n=1 Tax=uncultured Shimia sp. TaxID=573152 RepID=UPI00261B7E40|nr:hypothetical protein [uncultured Shimia sp.]
MEYAPSLAFLAVSLTTDSLRSAGWSGAGLALITCCLYAKRILSPHSLFLGINLYLLSITPTIEALYALDLEAAGAVLNTYAQPLLFLSILTTGCILAVVSKTGFLNIPHVNDSQSTKQSNRILIGVSTAATVWALSFDSNRFLQMSLPMILLFATHRALAARAIRKSTEPRRAPLGTPPE